MTNKYLNAQLDDVIFESRNKAYGAYALRQAYGKQMKRATIVGVTFFALLVSSPLIADRMATKKVALIDTIVEMTPIDPATTKPPVVPPPPPPPPPPPARQVATVRFVPPVVSEEAETEPPMPKMEDITVNVAAETKKGENVEAFVNIVQAPTAPPPPDEPKEAVKKEEETTFLIVEQMPEFKDGEKAMFRYLAENFKIPALARENGIEGTVYVSFVINKDGDVRDVTIKRGISGGCNEEAVRVVSSMPKWKPGRQNGKAVNVAFTLPIKIHLE
jgi:periplasmic protein TonB